MGIRQSMTSLVLGQVWRVSQSTSGGNFSYSSFMGLVDMLSTPAPIPISMDPQRMAWAMFAQACSPDEHCRLVVDRDVVWGMLTERAAMRKETAEVGGERTLPTQISWMDSGDTRKSESS